MEELKVKGIDELCEWLEGQIDEDEKKDVFQVIRNQKIKGKNFLTYTWEKWMFVGLPGGVAETLVQIAERVKKESGDEENNYRRWIVDFVSQEISDNQLLKVNMPFWKYGLDTIYVRDCYERLYQTIIEQSQTKNGHYCLEVTGTPGIGKTCFALYFLWMILNREENDIIYLQWRINQAKTSPLYRFSSGEWSELEKDPILLPEKNSWFIADSVAPIPTCGNVLLCASPNEKLTKYFGKDFGHTARYYMPLWNDEEFAQLQNECFPDFDNDTMMQRIKKFNYIPRIVFSDIFEYLKHEEGWNRSFAEVDVDKLHSYISGTNVSQLAHYLIHIEVKAETFSRDIYRFSSQDTLIRMLEIILSKEESKWKLFLMGKDSFRNVLRGKLFEVFAHNTLCAGGSFITKRLLSNENKQKKRKDAANEMEMEEPMEIEESFPVYVERYFRNEDEVNLNSDNTNYYWRPISVNYPGIDSLVNRCNFQITIREKHDLDLRKVSKIRDFPNRLYFVVLDQSRFDNWKYEQPFIGFTQNLEQYVLKIESTEEFFSKF